MARREARKPIGQRFVAIAALLFAGALLVGTTTPAAAFFVPVASKATGSKVTATTHGAQILQPTGSSAVAAAVPIADNQFSVMSYAEVAKLTAGYSNANYVVNNSGPVRWPFPIAVPLGDAFGPRRAPCAGCSTFHRGQDFQPGDGAPIYAIAKGVVTQLDTSDPSLGMVVYITHNIDGAEVTSLYGHMQSGSSPLKLGQQVAEGDLVGLVGSTGESSGPHLHLGILLGGPTASPIDPFVWLLEHTAH